jgi:glucosamine-6-phosphate deaminase
MQIIITENYEALSRLASDELIKQIKEKPNSIIYLPTGNTPLGMYEILSKKENAGLISFKETIFFNLDEYVGMMPNNPSSFYYYMQKNFYLKLKVKPKNYIFENLNNPAESCRNYENILKKYGPADMVVLGIGQNGHIGFNEPGSSREGRCKVISLTKETQRINNSPIQAMTMGIANILESRKIIQLISGESKKEIAAKVIEGEISPNYPASYLHEHSNVKIILDKEAASLLKQNYEK